MTARWYLASLALLAAGCIGPRATPRLGPDRAGLPRAIDALIAAPEFRSAYWGILIVDPATGDTLYAHNAHKLLVPASNMKIVTGAVALAQLGPDYRFRTSVAARGAVADSTLRGDLLVVGRGDPTVSDTMRTDALLPLLEIADSLRARGIRRIAGRVLSAGNAFPDTTIGYGWEWDDLAWAYGAGVDELLFNEGVVRVVVRADSVAGGPVTVTTRPSHSYPPVRVTATTVARTAATTAVTSPAAAPAASPATTPATGTTPASVTTANAAPNATTPSAAAPSAVAPGTAAPAPSAAPAAPDSATRITVRRDPLGRGFLVEGTIAVGDSVAQRLAQPHPSDAYLAALGEALARRGIAVGGAPADSTLPVDTLFTVLSPPLRAVLPALEKPSQNQIAEVLLRTLGLERAGVGTADSGRAVVERQLAAWGAEPDGYVVRDGSGLSRHNFLSPATVVRILTAVRADTAFRVFHDALPVAGVDGTLARRMRGTAAAGRVHAKTGTLGRVRSLSGYVTTAGGRPLVFSILVNNWTTPQRAVDQVQDTICVWLARLER